MGKIKIVLKSGKDQSLHQVSSMGLFRGNKKDIWQIRSKVMWLMYTIIKIIFLHLVIINPGSIAIRVMDFEKRNLDDDYLP